MAATVASRPFGGLRHFNASGRGEVVARAEAPMDVVVDHTDVLHERVHTRGPNEAVPLRLQLLRERFGCAVVLGTSARYRGARFRLSP
jgi:hypothetical protein